MQQIDSLILLVRSLTKTEKKMFRAGRSNASDYVALYDIIAAGDELTATDVRKAFEQQRQSATFNPTVSYLYKQLLDSLLDQHENHDSYFMLFDRILKARILFEKSMYEEALDQLAKAKREARRHDNQIALLYTSCLEVEYLMSLNMMHITEHELTAKHAKINEILVNIRRINEQALLYNLLRYRIIMGGKARSQKQKDLFNDLVISEMTINAASRDSFEIKKQHQLFQSNYLMAAGDYKSALHSFRELNTLFEHNQQHWANPPIYYLSVVEGILDNLRVMKRYEEMSYYLIRLRNIKFPTVDFQIHVMSTIFLYELFPMLDRGQFAEAAELMTQFREPVLGRLDRLNMLRKLEVSFYIALVHLGLKEFKRAQKILCNALLSDSEIYELPFFHAVRLLNLILHYEMHNLGIVRTESRSILRKLSKKEKHYRVERFLLGFMGKDVFIMRPVQVQRYWERIAPELAEIRSDIFEIQLLKHFDYTAWIEAKVLRTPLGEVLAKR
jgi:hypothetical protein